MTEKNTHRPPRRKQEQGPRGRNRNREHNNARIEEPVAESQWDVNDDDFVMEEESENFPIEVLRIGITHGDMNGIGYETILKAFAHSDMTKIVTPVIFGFYDVAAKCVNDLNIEEVELNPIKDLSEITEGVVNIIDVSSTAPVLTPGEATPQAGQMAVNALEMAIEALKEGEIDALVTAPICKESIQSESFKFPGHTEYLQAKDGAEDVLMILCDSSLRVVPVTRHLPLSEVKEKLTKELIVNTISKFNETLQRDFGIGRPRIAVLSLNPHAGDGGLLGTEENDVIIPAIEECIANGILAFGPFPADGFFGKSSHVKFDGIVSMYHDQGLTPFKMLARDGGVNFTSGLSFIRTSPDHGTAYDIAWKGLADPTSMRAAIYSAIDIFRHRRTDSQLRQNILKKYSQTRPDKEDRNHDKPDHRDKNSEGEDGKKD